jgi:hypothetical protein
MDYSFWAVFLFIIVGMVLRIRHVRAKYFLEKAAEEKTEQETHLNRPMVELEQAHEQLRAQGVLQGPPVDLAKMLGASSQKGPN